MFVRLERCTVKYDDNTVCTSVIGACDGAEALLSCRVPLHDSYNLQLDCMSVYLQSAESKVNSNSGYITLTERVICKPQQQTRLAHSRVSNEHQLEQVVAA